jgi:hypothetical protein
MKFPKCITNLTGKTIWLWKNLRVARISRVLKVKWADKYHPPLHAAWHQAALKVISRTLWPESAPCWVQLHIRYSLAPSGALAGQLQSLGVMRQANAGSENILLERASECRHWFAIDGFGMSRSFWKRKCSFKRKGPLKSVKFFFKSQICVLELDLN